MNNQYEMRITKNFPQPPKGTYVITQRDIDNIPYMNLFIEDSINNKIQKACKKLLYYSMTRKDEYKYGEMLMLVSLTGRIDDHIFTGNHAKVDLQSIIQNYKGRDLLVIHNHPNNSFFSYKDLATTIDNSKIYGVIAIGNKHNIFVFLKDHKEKYELLYKHLKRINDNDIQDIKSLANKALLKIKNHDLEKYGIYKYRRINK